ncbi:MAG: XTP/dITP diphosphatase [Christensenellales bacterium]|jgi:non-canonical purine NTP pyrophosphatase, rdgB/HAM1 family
MKLIIASNNAHKVSEIKAILGCFYDEILSLREAGIDMDVVEDTNTFEGNALKKAREVFAVADADAVLSDDSGLMVDALGGAPGVYSARYAGEGHDDAANNAKLLDALRDVPDEKRTARFCTSVALIRKGMPAVTANGSVEGRILRSSQGENGFGYDPLFYYEPLKKSFAQLTPEEKNSVSHRRRALESLCDKLRAEK